MHGADAHSRYKFVGEPNPNPENKQLLIIPDASHCDLYDGGYEEKAGQGQPKNMIPWDKLAAFFKKSIRSV
jgi:hypothetical protein